MGEADDDSLSDELWWDGGRGDTCLDRTEPSEQSNQSLINRRMSASVQSVHVT
jgi:hypothetical protein